MFNQGECSLAQRLQSIAKPGQIVITEEVYNKAKESFSCELIGPMALRNKAQQVVVYQVLS